MANNSRQNTRFHWSFAKALEENLSFEGNKLSLDKPLDIAGDLKVVGKIESTGDVSVGGKLSFAPEEIGTLSGDSAKFTSSATSYRKAVIVGNILWLIIEDVVTAVSSETTFTFSLSPALSATIASKIYRKDGTKTNAAYSTDPSICKSNAVVGSASRIVGINSYSANALSLYIDTSATNIGSTYPISARIAIVLV